MDAAIARATMELLAEVGYESLSIEQVAARAGISKSTLYRRYSAKVDLVVATLASMPALRGVDVVGDGQPIREVLLGMLRHGATVVSTPGSLGALSALTSGRPADRELAEAMRGRVMGPQIRQVSERLAKAVAMGEIRADVPLDVAITTLWGALIARSLSGEPLDDAWLEQVLAIVWDGIAPKA